MVAATEDFVMFKLSKPPSDPLGPLVAQHPPRTPHGRVAPDRHSWPEAGKSEGLNKGLNTRSRDTRIATLLRNQRFSTRFLNWMLGSCGKTSEKKGFATLRPKIKYIT